MSKKTLKDIPLGSTIKYDDYGTADVVAVSTSQARILIGWREGDRKTTAGWTVASQNNKLLWEESITLSSKPIPQLYKDYTHFYWVDYGNTTEWDVLEKTTAIQRSIKDCPLGSVIEIDGQKGTITKIHSCGNVEVAFEKETLTGNRPCSCEITSSLELKGEVCSRTFYDAQTVILHSVPKEEKQAEDTKQWIDGKQLKVGDIVELSKEDSYNGGTVISISANKEWITIGFEQHTGYSWDTQTAKSNIGYPNYDTSQFFGDKEKLTHKYKAARNIRITDNKFKVIGTDTLPEAITDTKSEWIKLEDVPPGSIVEFDDNAYKEYNGGVVLGVGSNELCVGFEAHVGNAWPMTERSLTIVYENDKIWSKDNITKYKYGRYIFSSSTKARIIGKVDPPIPEAKKVSAHEEKAIEKALEGVRVEKEVAELTKEFKYIQSGSKTKPTISLKDDAKDALYRVAIHQITRGLKVSLISTLQKSGHNNIKALSELLDTEYGSAILSAAAGYALTALPTEDERIKKLAREFRISGFAIAGGAMFDTLLQYMVPVISNAFTAEPKEQVRIETLTRIGMKVEKSNEETDHQEISQKEAGATNIA